jgi:hypothetical protein
VAGRAFGEPGRLMMVATRCALQEC